MPSDTTLPGALGWVLWYSSEVAFKWVPGFIISLSGGQVNDTSGVQSAPPPLITQPVRVEDVIAFLKNTSAPGTYDQLYHEWNLLVAFSLTLSLIFAAIIIYTVTRVFQLRQEEYKYFQAVAHTVTAQDIPKTRLRWNHILEEANSDSPQNQRLAILEADIMLSELLDELGYKGETLADKMRQVPKANFNTIDLAWEAHRARNRVAHEAGFQMAPHEVRRIIGLYDKIFREFGFIEE
jgi:hypothetical protein